VTFMRKRKHSRAFKVRTVKRALKPGVVLAELAREHEIHYSLLHQWIAAVREKGRLAFPKS
jgi:transposase-like protein